MGCCLKMFNSKKKDDSDAIGVNSELNVKPGDNNNNTSLNEKSIIIPVE